ncbi:hypothetical protein BDC45DRAFT_508419 [Circinella umbellata]|nr:hypothetical protein BDC45DRAFT_508419 [Circinella umbellata]
MDASTEDSINNTNNVLQTYDEVQKLCETIKNNRNYPKRSIHHVITTTNSFIPSKRVRSAETVMDNTENTPPKNNMNNELASEEFSPTGQTTNIPLKLSLDREAFYKRLETYSTLFVSKRRPVNALQCAMHGFIDTHIAGGAKGNICKLSCSTCDCTNFVIDISCFNPNIPKVQEIKQTYLEELSKSHRPGCFWKFDKCSDDIYAFPYSTSTEALDLIKTEGTRLLECHSLPIINHPLTTEQSEKLDVIIDTFENANNNTFSSSESKRTPYIFAMFGWRLDNNKNSLKCHHCFRTIQNSSFTSSSSSFNLINNHMEYCSWINRKQAMIQPMNEEGIKGNTEDNSICGYEWMIHMMDLEYDFLFYIRESSAEYQESRLQWFRNTRRRMAESRAALAMEFPDSPESIPELTKDIGDEGDQILLEKEEEKPVTNEESVISDEQLQEQEHVDEEPSIPENEDEAQVEPTETSKLESTKEQEEEEEEKPSSKPSQEVEDELMDFMESEPEDEGEAEPTTTDVTTAATTTTTVEEEKVEETTVDIDIDVSLLEDVQTPTTGVSTPVPDQLQQDHLDDEVHDDNGITVTPSSSTKESSSPLTSTIESTEDEAATIMNATIDMEMTDKAQETLTTSGDKDVQEQQADNTPTTVLTPSIQVEEIVDDGNELINDENMNQVAEESSTAPIISMEEDVDLVSSSPTTVDGQEKEHVSTPEEKEEEEYKDDTQHQEQDETDQFKTEEQVEDETTDQSNVKSQEKEEDETSVDLAVQQQQEEEDNKSMEVLEQTVPQVGHDVSEDAIVITNMEEEEKEEKEEKETEEMEEVQDTTSVSTKLEQENDTTGSDKDNERQTPTSDSLEGLEEEEDGLDHSQHTISNDDVLHTKQSDDLIQETEQEGEVTEPQEEEMVSNDESKPKTTSVIDKESTTKEKEEEEETIEEVEETVDGVIVSETTIISSTEKTSNDEDNGENEDEKEADNTSTTVEIVELDNENNEKDNSETHVISLDNTRDGMTTMVSDSVNEVKEQSDITEFTDEYTAAATEAVAGVEATNASENVVVENTQSEEELKPLMDNFGTPISNQSGSTPQILQSMEDALGQSPGHPDTSTTATITDNDTQQAVELTETSAQESSVAAVTKEEEEQTTTVVINDDDNAPKKDFEDPMIEDRQEVIVSNPLVGTATKENNNNDSNASNENTTGAQGHDYVEQGGEKEVNSGGESGNGTIGEAMDEDNNNDSGGDVNMREIVDEEMENVEEEQGEAMEEVPAPPTTITTTVAAATEESRQL